MAIELRKEMDIGYIEGTTPVIQYVNEERHGQVYQATHDGEGNPLSIIDRSLISFSWGGKNIEDFSLLVVNDGDRYSGNLYTGFKDLITEYDIINGQQYWGTTYSANTKDFQLATDGITEKTLQEFKAWFKPGIERELILAEHPNRAIKARLSVTPQYSLLPFECIENIVLGEQTYNVKSTLWKGSIVLNFVMDDPFWYSIEDRFRSTTINPLTPRQLNAIIEDGVPEIRMFNTSCLLASGYYYDNENNMYTTNFNLSLDNNIYQYLYYCGTAPESPIITFDIMTNIENDYFQLPGNSYISKTKSSIFIDKKDMNSNNYNNIATFTFTAPDILLSYNQAISILKNDFTTGDSIVELKSALRDAISHPIIRKNVLGICDRAMINGLNICNTTTSKILSNGISNIIINLRKTFPETNSIKCSFMFNSKLGKATITIPINILTTDTSNIVFTSQPIPEVNNAGDMVRSRYLILDERTLPNANNLITEAECLRLRADCPITNFKIQYKYKYL